MRPGRGRGAHGHGGSAAGRASARSPPDRRCAAAPPRSPPAASSRRGDHIGEVHQCSGNACDRDRVDDSPVVWVDAARAVPARRPRPPATRGAVTSIRGELVPAEPPLVRGRVVAEERVRTRTPDGRQVSATPPSAPHGQPRRRPGVGGCSRRRARADRSPGPVKPSAYSCGARPRRAGVRQRRNRSSDATAPWAAWSPYAATERAHGPTWLPAVRRVTRFARR